MRAYRTRSNLDEEKRRPKPAPPVGLISFGSRYEGAPLQTTPLHFAIEWPERSGTAPRAAYAQSPRWVKRRNTRCEPMSSALPLKADSSRTSPDVSKVPISDIDQGWRLSQRGS